MKLHPRVTRSVIELVKGFEGLRRRAARLADGGWTIGYGHTRSARDGAVVSPEDAEALLYYDLSEVAEKLEAWTFTPLNQNQFEALTAFAFNIGLESFRYSTVLKRVNEGQTLLAASALELWRKADFGGEDLVIDALVRRRAAEKAHFLTPPEGFRPTPSPVLRPTFDHSVIEAAANFRAGRSAAIVDTPLEGDEAVATIEPQALTDLDHGAPPLATTVAAGAAAATLHQLFPETSEAGAMSQAEATPFTLDGEAHGFDEAPAEAVNDHPFGSIAEAKTEVEAPPFESGPTLQPFPSVLEVAPPAPNKPLDTAPPPFGDLRSSARSQHDDANLLAHRKPGFLHDRSVIFFGIGLLGVALLVAALFFMFSGKADPTNLVVGLLGIALMAPAGGQLLLQFFSRRDGPFES